MPNKTTNLGLNVFLENEVVDFEEINDNFEALDGMVMCIEKGTKTSYYSGGTGTVASWRYKKFSDGHVEMYTKLEFANLKCDGGTAAPYYSGACQVYFPFQLAEIHDAQMHIASETVGWIVDTTGKNTLDYVTFKVVGMEKEETAVYKQIYISVKGRLA